MKKIIICLVSLLLCCYVNAQNLNVSIALRFMDNEPDLAKSVGSTLSSMFTEFYSSWNSNTPPDLDDLYIADNTKQKILGLWKRHKFRLAGLSCALGVAKISGENAYAVFSIPMQVDGSDNVVEYILQFNTSGVITNFERSSFPIVNYQTGTRVMDEQTKGFIKTVLYQLRNAYNEKNMAYLNKIYDKNGYCIVGKKATTQSSNGAGQEIRIQLEHQYYDLTMKRLGQYLDDLKRVFDNNKMVQVNFGDPEITAHQNPNPAYDGIYYINVSQDYKSDVYEDHGWLTLVLDLRNKSNPQIRARIWLPEKITNQQLTNLF